MEKITIEKSAIVDLVNLTNEINDRVESLELMSDKKFMKSFKKAKQQIKKKRFCRLGCPLRFFLQKNLKKILRN